MRLLLRGERYWDWIFICLYTILVGLFFYQTLIFGKIPVPTDTLVGLYSPYRESYANQYPNGIPFKNFLITDPIRQQIPWRKTIIDSLRRGKVGLWNPYSFSGTPLFANIQSGALYPLNIFFLMFPFFIAWTLLIISQPLLSGIFLYIFLRHKKLHYGPAFFGAICFSFSGFSIAWLTWGTMISTWLWTPLTLLAIDRIFEKDEKRKVLWVIIAGLSIVCSFFAGHIQIFIYSLMFSLFYMLWFYRRAFSLKNIYLYLIGFCVIYILTAPQLLHIIEWLPQTSRLFDASAWKTDGFFIPFHHLAQFLAPDYFGNPATLNYWGTWNYGEMVGYIGVSGLLMAFIGIGSETIFWVVMLVVGLLFAVASPISFLPYQLRIPLISSLQPTRLLVIVDYCLSILAAYGLSNIAKPVKKKHVLLCFSVMFVLMGILGLSVIAPKLFNIPLDKVIIVKRNLVMPAIMIVGSALIFILTFICFNRRKYASILLTVLIILMTVIDLLRFGWKFTPFTNTSYFFPTTKTISFLEKQSKPFRIMTTDDKIFPPNVNEFYGIESINGYDPLYSSRYEEFIAAMERGVPNINPPFGFNRIIVPKNTHSPLFSLLGIRFILSYNELPEPDFHKVFEEGPLSVYEDTRVMPRAYLVERVVYKTNKQDIMNQLYSPEFDLRYSAVVEYPVDVLDTPLTLDEFVFIRAYDNNKIVVDAAVEQKRLLVIGNIFDAGWRATVDGMSTPIYRTNYIFMGIQVPAGRHSVVIEYD